MLRVTRPGGLVVVAYMLWLGPHGGHETSPWHYLGGERAARRYERDATVTRPKNRYGSHAVRDVAVGCCAGPAAGRTPSVLTAEPRYHPSWALGGRVPGLRECRDVEPQLVLTELM